MKHTYDESKSVLFFYDWSYFQDVVSLLNQAKKYCFHGIWMWVIFKAQTSYPNGEEDIQRILNQNVFTTLFCQLSQPNLKQHRLPPTSQRSQQWLAAGGHQGCGRETDWGESVFPDPDCQDFSLNSVWWVTWEMKALLWHFISWQSKILSQKTAST